MVNIYLRAKMVSSSPFCGSQQGAGRPFWLRLKKSTCGTFIQIDLSLKRTNPGCDELSFRLVLMISQNKILISLFHDTNFFQIILRGKCLYACMTILDIPVTQVQKCKQVFSVYTNVVITNNDFNAVVRVANKTNSKRNLVIIFIK